MNDRAIVAVLSAILFVGKKLGNPRSHPHWPDTVKEARQIMDAVVAELAPPEAETEPEEDDFPEPLAEGEEPSAEVEGADVPEEDFEIDDLL